jgi:hypothetical protein
MQPCWEPSIDESLVNTQRSDTQSNLKVGRFCSFADNSEQGQLYPSQVSRTGARPGSPHLCRMSERNDERSRQSYKGRQHC